MKTETERPAVNSSREPGGRARQIPVPKRAKAISRLSRIDYADAFEVDVNPGDRSLTGEQWARRMLEGTPRETQVTLRAGWTMIGLKLGPAGSPEHVLGWEIGDSGPDHVLLVADSRTGMPAELLFKPEGGRFLFCTFIRQANPLMKVIWWPVERNHVMVVPRLLDRAAGAQ